MRIVRTIREMRDAVAAERAGGRRIGFVPTMGAFHEGHRSLMRRARAECECVVVSLFVNPTQFNEAADLAAYPRDERADAACAAAERVDVLFAPPAAEMYPPGFATSITVAGLGDVLEGAERGPAHFRGVATVVAKLLDVVQPHRLYLGQKDAQQVAVLRRMIRDLDLPVDAVVCPTVREHDGLAMSSRNVRLGAGDRARALALRHGLDAALARIAHGDRDPASVAAAAASAMEHDGVAPEYFVAVDADTLAPLDRLGGEVLLAVAARVGGVRLIDNERVSLP